MSWWILLATRWRLVRAVLVSWATRMRCGSLALGSLAPIERPVPSCITSWRCLFLPCVFEDFVGQLVRNAPGSVCFSVPWARAVGENALPLALLVWNSPRGSIRFRDPGLVSLFLFLSYVASKCAAGQPAFGLDGRADALRPPPAAWVQTPLLKRPGSPTRCFYHHFPVGVLPFCMLNCKTAGSEGCPVAPPLPAWPPRPRRRR